MEHTEYSCLPLIGDLAPEFHASTTNGKIHFPNDAGDDPPPACRDPWNPEWPSDQVGFSSHEPMHPDPPPSPDWHL